MSRSLRCAIIGSGNIGTDLLVKGAQISEQIEMVAMIGIDPNSDGIALATSMDLVVCTEGLAAFLEQDRCNVDVFFDATSASAHARHAKMLASVAKQAIDLTPAAVGPYVIPSVNIDDHLDALNINMVTCGGQATVPVVAAIDRVSPVVYAEIVSSIASRSAGPGTRANIDEFTETTAHSLEMVGGAQMGKAIIILNPAEPPVLMRNTIFSLVESGDRSELEAAITTMVDKVAEYVPGYRLRHEVQFERLDESNPTRIPELDRKFTGWKISVLVEVEGAAHYLPSFAGNLDIMTSAALQTAERLALSREFAA